MSNQNDTNEQLIRDLQAQVADLKRLAGNLAEAATKSRDKVLSWVYAMEGNRDGVWDWNAVTNEVFFSPRWKEMLGYDEDEIASELSEWDKRVHPDDRDAVYADLNAHLTAKPLSTRTSIDFNVKTALTYGFLIEERYLVGRKTASL